MKPGDKIQMRVDGGRWLEATVLFVSISDRPAMVAVDEGIPFPFTLLGDKQAVAVKWDGDQAGDLFVRGRRIEFRPAGQRNMDDSKENS